uniref:Uncharacterized protein n=1 Tax=Trypanosoma congolense (strain IL3000) TaxID=1068625 RepID=G0UVV7_TRYCI|nr:conserved hypothetical protein [Trypanosoma congolense IL3000]
METSLGDAVFVDLMGKHTSPPCDAAVTGSGPRLVENNSGESGSVVGGNNDNRFCSFVSTSTEAAKISTEITGRHLSVSEEFLINQTYGWHPAETGQHTVRLRCGSVITDTVDSMLGCPASAGQHASLGISPRNNTSVGYNDDIGCSFFSSPVSGVTPLYYDNIKGTNVEAVSSTEGPDLFKGLAEPMSTQTATEIPVDGVAESLESLSSYGAGRYDKYPNPSGDGGSASACGVSTGAALADYLEGENGRKDDRIASFHEEDEVVGVTAEGEFIYRRDVDAEPERQRCRSYYQPITHQSSSESRFADVNHSNAPNARGRAHADGKDFNFGSRSGVGRAFAYSSQCGGGMSYCHTRGPPATFEWTTDGAQQYSMLLRYRTCENADEIDYERILNYVDNMREARRNHPAELLQQRLEEERQRDGSGRFPLVLRW